MKTIYKLLLVVAALSATVFVSCKKDDPYKDDDTYVAKAVETPEYADAIKVVDLSKVATPVTTKKGDIVKSIEFTESGYAIITKESTKADSDVTTTVTTYTFAAGVYKVAGFGDIKIDGAKITITAASGNDAPAEDVEVEATVTTPSAANSDFYSSWKIYSTNVVVNGEGVKVDHIFEGSKAASLYEMAKYINEKKQVIEADDFKGYVIESVTLTKNGTFLVKFQGADPYVGDFSLSGNKFSYKLDVEGNFALNAEANGTINIDKDSNLCILDINGSFKYNNDSYTTKVTLKLEQIKNVN